MFYWEFMFVFMPRLLFPPRCIIGINQNAHTRTYTHAYTHKQERVSQPTGDGQNTNNIFSVFCRPLRTRVGLSDGPPRRDKSGRGRARGKRSTRGTHKRYHAGPAGGVAAGNLLRTAPDISLVERAARTVEWV